MKKKLNEQAPFTFFDRDVSWLSFNERILTEASRNTLPLMERIRFLSIYSSNLDEFYRVRMPTLLALNKLSEKGSVKSERTLEKINATILRQLEYFGSIIQNQILSSLRNENIRLLYKESIPEAIADRLKQYFIVTVASFIQIVDVSRNATFFPENNKLYFCVLTQGHDGVHQNYIVNIPSDVLPRFFTLTHDGLYYIIFLDDIVRLNLAVLFKETTISSFSFKITRNAELDLEDEFSGNLARKIERKIHQRDFGLATRFLYEPGLPEDTLSLLKRQLNLKGASFIVGGSYHNLKDLATLPLTDSKFHYEPWPKAYLKTDNQLSLFDQIKKGDLLLHPPYHSYDAVIRFFNEASIDPSVHTIYITLYRVANDSRIVNALISAAKNGKQVIVFVELKARFDEANNIKWSKRMKEAGARIIESIPGLKVHAKLALVKRKTGSRSEMLGLFSTGNFNEGTAKFYTDHLLMTSDKRLLTEAELLFKILKKRKKKIGDSVKAFN
jgi:polyphosphate kinase